MKTFIYLNHEIHCSALSMASTFQSTKNTAKSADDLKKARETRAAEALRMKDEQLKILSDQNASLLATLDKVREFM
jgi:myosin protein heavy chain